MKGEEKRGSKCTPNTLHTAHCTNYKSTTRIASIIIAIAIGMFCMAYAAVPLYNLFCKVTGYGGTPTIANDENTSIGTRSMTVRFNADINRTLPWKFYPKQQSITAKTGENMLVFYGAKNIADVAVTGTATFNVTPLKAASYFVKIDCFCFNEQTLAPGQEVDMPVTFYIDPEIENDPQMQDVKTFTLSYTFFEVEKTSD